MIRLAHYRPAFFSGFEDVADVTVPDTESALQIPWIKQWSDGSNFDYWSVESPDTIQPALMATLKDGKFWVVAFVREGRLDLPTWVCPR